MPQTFMQFNSYTFVVFFLVVLALHYAPLPWTLKKINLLWTSYVFYAAWNPPFVILLWLTTLVDFFCGRAIGASESPSTRKIWLAATLAINLGLLAFFKYGAFAVDNFQAAARVLGVSLDFKFPSLVLPMGISFYVFISLSYTIDVYRRRIEACRSILDYSLYVTFFPHLVCGPIIRAHDLLPQLSRERLANREQFSKGLTFLIFGLFQKVVLADAFLAPIVEKVYGGSEVFGAGDAWTATLAFAGQIFFDFSGYSTCAIGVALCLGFWLPQNFRAPYSAVGFSDFWKRWHCSLSTWLRDYLYIPLGGSKCGPLRTKFNLMVTMLLGGLWHGAAWTFVIWGALHGLLLIVEHSLRSSRGGKAISHSLGAVVLTLVAICFTWVFFRSTSLSSALEITKSMLCLNGFQSVVSPYVKTDFAVVAIVLGGLFLAHWTMRGDASQIEAEDRVSELPVLVRSIAIAAMLVSILMSPGSDRAFIYFQF